MPMRPCNGSLKNQPDYIMVNGEKVYISQCDGGPSCDICIEHGPYACEQDCAIEFAQSEGYLLYKQFEDQ